jgi:SAM-dependent methyltransferase
LRARAVWVRKKREQKKRKRKEREKNAGRSRSPARPLRDSFADKVYKDALAAGKPVPWDVQRAQPALSSVSSAFRGSVLDVGCGLGDNARWLADLPGVDLVAAVDFAPDAIRQAQERGDAGGKVSFHVADVFDLGPSLGDATFDALLDSAVFDCIGDDVTQRRYLAAVSTWIKAGGKVVMLVFSDRNKDPWVGPRRISPAHALTLWAEAGWEIDTLDNQQFYLDTIGRNEGKGGHALLMVATKPCISPEGPTGRRVRDEVAPEVVVKKRGAGPRWQNHRDGKSKTNLHGARNGDHDGRVLLLD